VYLHNCKGATVSFRLPTGDKATFFEATLRSEVPVKGVKVDFVQGCGTENMVEQGGDGISAVALILIVTVTDHDPQLCLPLDLVDVVIHEIAYMLALQILYGKAAPLPTGMAQLIGIVG